ncbi:MAG: MarR family transcriptional regulator [Pseudomonadota bacterium]
MPENKTMTIPSASPSPRDVDRLRQSVHLLVRTFLVAGRAGEPAEGKIPFNALYFHMLGVLTEAETMRPTALADMLGVPRSTLSTASKALQRRGLIDQSADPADGRAQILRLTEEGRRVANAIKRQDHKNMRTLLEMVDPARRKIVIDVLEDVSSRISGVKND